MKRLLLFFLILGLPAVSPAHQGHGGHGGSNPYKELGIEIDERQAMKFSKAVINKLVEKEKLEESWNQAEYEKSEKKRFKKELEWVVSFHNNKTPGSKSTLYIFLSLYGDFLGANFTGN
jgi:hypothetical protein